MVLRPASGNLEGPAGREQKQGINGPKAVEADQAPEVKTFMGYLFQFEILPEHRTLLKSYKK